MRSKTTMNTRKDSVTRKDLQAFKDEIIQQFHIISDGLIDQIKLLAEGHSGIIRKLDQMEKENERQHLETRSMVKLSFSELDRRISDLESQMKEVQEWKKQVQVRFQV
jgi:hypothetical protein